MSNQEPERQPASWKASLGVALIAAVFAWPLCRRGIVVSDEGYLLQQAVEMLSGKVPYRDLDAFVTPGVWFLLAGLFSVFEPSVIVSRIPALLGFAAICVVCFRIAHRLAGGLAGAVAVAGLLTFCVWAFPSWTFSFYSPFAMLFALASLERLLAWRDSERSRDLLAASLMVALAVVFKQNYGALAAAGLVAGVFAIRLERRSLGVATLARDGGWVVVGQAIVAGPLLLYLALAGALPAALDSLVVRPFSSFAAHHTIPYPSLERAWSDPVFHSRVEELAYAATPLWRVPFANLEIARLAQRGHIVLYWAAPMVLGALLLAALLASVRRRRLDGGLATVALGCTLLFLGVFPRADFNHLMHVYQPVVLAGAILVGRLAKAAAPLRVPARACALGLLLAAVPFALVAGSWYRSLVRTLDHPIPVARAGVLVNGIEASLMDVSLTAMKLYSEPGESVLTVPDLAMFNFLAERRAPTGHYNLYETHIGHDQGAAVVAAAERDGTRLALVRSGNPYYDQVSLREYAPRLDGYLRSHFEIAFSLRFSGDLVLRRREAPRPERAVHEILPHCRRDEPGQDFRKHSWFWSLRQMATRPEPDDATSTSSCELELPAGSRTLSVLLDYLHPLKVDTGTAGEFRLLLRSEGETHELLFEAIDAEPMPAYVIPPPLERRIDVSRWAGRRVTLVFGSAHEGVWTTSRFDGSGFTAVWLDPVIELNAAEASAAPTHVTSDAQHLEDDASQGAAP